MSTSGRPAEAQVYQLRVTLRDVSPLMWCRLLVRSDTTIARLHDVLRIAKGWEDVHLQQFLIYGNASYGVYHERGITFADNPHRVRLADFRFRRGERFVYEYDFGDWLDEIPQTFSRLQVNVALRQKMEEWTCTSAST